MRSLRTRLSLACIPVICAVPAHSQVSGRFVPTGDLTTPRYFHTATLLITGKVLITGGWGTGSILASAELYDPSTGAFTRTGDMASPRWFHTATRLPDGRVLIAGGAGSDGPLAAAELYDPATGAFAPAASMIAGRVEHTATLLGSGKVLIAGGRGLRSAELYDPVSGTFSPTGEMSEAGAETATLLPNGHVLVTKSAPGTPNRGEEYDPVSGVFTRTSEMLDPLQGHFPTATLLSSGKVWIAGGDLLDMGGSVATELYDPETATFRLSGSMPTGLMRGATATILGDGKVLLSGRDLGTACNVTTTNPSYSNTCPGAATEYDPRTETFGPVLMSQSQEGHRATLLADGTVLLSGGWVCCGFGIAEAQLYVPAVLSQSPRLLTNAGEGSGQGAILHAGSDRAVSAADPAVAGEAIEIYATGLIASSVIPPQVAIEGRAAELLYFGPAPGFLGLCQVNVRVPPGVVPESAAAVRLIYLDRPSNSVTIGVH